MGIGFRLKELLRDKKITIKELADSTGIPVNTLYSITKRDSNRVDSVILRRIVDTLGIHMYDLTGAEYLPIVLKKGVISVSDIAAEMEIPVERVQAIVDNRHEYSEETVKKVAAVAALLDAEFQKKSEEEQAALLARATLKKVLEFDQGTGGASRADGSEDGNTQFDSVEDRIMYFYSLLNEEGRRVAADRVQELSEIPKYRETLEGK